MKKFIKTFSQISSADVAKVGGKNASLGEMINKLKPLGVDVPDGFAVTVEAYSEFLSHNALMPHLQKTMDRLDRQSLSNLAEVGEKCRSLILSSMLPPEVEQSIAEAHAKLMARGVIHSVAVRSSATAEDSPTTSFAGQHESFLNVTGVNNVLQAVKKCYASLFKDRAIKYRIDNGFGDLQIGLSVGVQLMVRSDRGSAGVIFTIEPENGNKNLIYLTGAWGLGEAVVQGAVNTDEFYLFKPAIETGKSPIVYRAMGSKEQKLIYSDASGKTIEWAQTSPSQRDQFVLSDLEVETLGKWSLVIEQHYKTPMDIEWAKDGDSAFYPREVIVRMSDFKTNEYAKLLGGKLFEPEEENPMLGFRGASRYYHESYTEGFGLECAAIKKVREEMMLNNVKVMIPFCRTIDEAKKVLQVMSHFQLKRKENGLEVYVMAEIPSNILLARKFSQLFDGFSIGSNDLTQLTLGLDRDSEIVSHLFNENDESVKFLIRNLIEIEHENGVKVGLCGQAPSDYPGFAKFLVSSGIDSVSFNPDALIRGIQNISEAELANSKALETV